MPLFAFGEWLEDIVPWKLRITLDSRKQIHIRHRSVGRLGCAYLCQRMRTKRIFLTLVAVQGSSWADVLFGNNCVTRVASFVQAAF